MGVTGGRTCAAPSTRDTELSGGATWPRATRSRCGTARPTATRRSSPIRGPSTCGASPNPHVGFGGGGAHFCLGANLARREITVAFEELHRRIPDITATEEPDRLQSAFIHGIKRLPVAWTPPG